MHGHEQGATAATGQHDADADTRLDRSVTGELLLLFILGDVLGAGIYALFGVMAGEVGGAVWLPMPVALVLAMLTAASYAELVTKYPRAGASAVFVERAYRSRLVSFFVGYCMLAAGVTSAAGLSLAFGGDYLGVFLDVPAVPAAVVFLLLVALLNARGIRESVRANVVMTVIEVSGLVLVVILGALVPGRGDGDVGRVTEFPEGVSVASGVLAAAVLAYYSFVGFETSANVAEEARDVRRVYPRALFGALLVAGVVYLLVGLAASVVLAPDALAGSTGPLLEVVRAADVGVPDRLFSAIALIAVANGALLTMIMSSRLVFGMAEQGLVRRPLARGLPGRRTPWVAIVVTTLVAIGLTLTGDLGDHRHRRPGAAEGRGRRRPLPGVGRDPGAGRRVLGAAAVAAGGGQLARRRHPPGRRGGPVPAGPGTVVAVGGGAGPAGADPDRLLRGAATTARIPGWLPASPW